MAAVDPPFALSPALATNLQIDYTSTAGIKIWQEATRKFAEEPFDCNAWGLRDFLQLVRDRSSNSGWHDSILTIPEDVADPLLNLSDFLEHYGEISIEHLRDHAATYVGTPTRAAQDSVQLATSLINSLSREGRNKVTIHRDEYTINGQIVGILVLKIIIRESYIDTNATTTHIRSKLSSLDDYLPSVGHDIGKMNLYVLNLIEALTARGETSNDILSNLFKGYKAAKDHTFVRYIEKKEDAYEEGAPMTYQALMTFAKNKYDVLVQKELWNAPTPEEEKIIALEATVKKLQGQQKRIGGNSNKPKPKEKVRKPAAKPDEAWMKVEPADKTKSKNVKGKEWWWCDNHKKFTRHKTSACRGMGIPKGTPNNKSDDDRGDTKSSKLVRALEAAAQDGEQADE